ncbi:MAG: hypothetical protein IKK43_04915 [Clostridia bacterium]|nr:hypothetical protein [Clostridia bacterium]
MIGEMLLGIAILLGIYAVIGGITYLLYGEFDDVVLIIPVMLGSFIGVIVGFFLPCNMQGSFYSLMGALFVTFIIGGIILRVCEVFDFSEIIALVCTIVILIGSYAGFWYLHLCNTDQDPYSRNIVRLEEPVITETKYEILGGSDTTRISGYVYGGIYYTRGSTSENSYFKVYIPCKNSDGETVVMPYTLRESDVTVILMPDLEEGSEYLLQTVATYYKEDRNKEPAEIIEDRKVVTYKLYVSESTFSGMKIDGD